MSHTRNSSRMVSALAGALLSAVAVAQTFTFEAPTYNGSAAGTIVTGQDGWYVPAAGGVDGKVFTYAGNAYGIPTNSTGGDQFLVGQKSTVNFSRAQRDLTFGDGTTGCRRMCFDVTGSFFVGPDSDPNGVGQNNLGSVSIQPTALIFLLFWGDPVDPNFAGNDTWNLGVLGYDTTGGGGGVITGVITYFPNSQFVNIPQGQWMRVCTNVDLDENRMTRVEISQVGSTDFDFYDSTAADEFYLNGGATGNTPINGVRLFGGGGAAGSAAGSGNTASMDNLVINPTCADNPCPCTGNINTNGTSATVIDINDLTSLLAAFGGAVPNPCYDLNSSGTSAGVVDINDLTALLALFGSSCP